MRHGGEQGRRARGAAERAVATGPANGAPAQGGSESRRHWVVLVVLCLGTFAILLDSTIVNVALPSIITDLHAPLDQALWVVNAYLLVFAALLILAGRLGDMFR